MLSSRTAAALVAIALSAPVGVSLAQAPLPQFDRVLLLETTSETSANASIGDVNGDGKPDIMLAKGRHWPLIDRLLLGDGKGGFAPATDLGTASDRSYAARLVDLDGDGDLDVVGREVLAGLYHPCAAAGCGGRQRSGDRDHPVALIRSLI